ncbi:putative 2OG-Fe(II) oxygenase [Novosphingobium sp. FKTRR1]|uniref:putative 2OG-Fe(II) oxygenase n=1 Tax=Novosphingobium sp. FKTRR1 TaxID=2879118 RepID=UPI001CF093E5|nr:putative 2OG-Fe(II) oxygenase [Novosphingobium sp. FKTRR1]
MKRSSPPTARPVSRCVAESAASLLAEGLLAEGLKARADQRLDHALGALTRAAHIAPRDANVALALAHVRYEAGLTAVEQFARARDLAPERFEPLRGHALALAGEGETTAALALLDETLAANPLWLDGHRLAASLRTTAGLDDFDVGFARAVKAAPDALPLWLGWFHLLAQARCWERASAVLDAAQARFGTTRAVRFGRLYLLSESGEAADDPALFDAVEGEADAGLDLARIRHFLRGGQWDRARQVGERHLGQPSVRPFWPYLTLAWRLLDDPRGRWLDRGMDFVRTIDLGLSEPELTDLAVTLRALHTARAPWHEQSVRGGTQTDRPLLLRLDPAIMRVRSAIEQAVAGYIAQLPRPDATHPLLAPPRAAFRLAGSWSVRLRAQGYHATHTHPQGWISSALYVSVPPVHDLGAAPAGHLQFGAGPPELGLPLQPYGDVAPAAGRLILFPSTLWHGTVPFVGGERLTIAFDVVPAVQ